MGALGRAVRHRSGLPAGPCWGGSQAGAGARGERGSAVPRVGVQRAGGELWCRAPLQPVLPPGMKHPVAGRVAQRGWLQKGEHRDPFTHRGSFVHLAGVGAGICVNLEGVSISYAPVCVHTHTHTQSPQWLCSGGMAKARRAGGAARGWLARPSLPRQRAPGRTPPACSSR